MAPQDGLGTATPRQPGMPATDAGQALVTKDQNKAMVGGRAAVKGKLGKGASLVSVADQLHVFDRDPNAVDIKRILNATAAGELSNIENWIENALAPTNDYDIVYVCDEIDKDTIKNVKSVTFSKDLVGQQLRITVTPIWK